MGGYAHTYRRARQLSVGRRACSASNMGMKVPSFLCGYCARAYCYFIKTLLSLKRGNHAARRYQFWPLCTFSPMLLMSLRKSLDNHRHVTCAHLQLDAWTRKIVARAHFPPSMARMLRCNN
eukprot:2070712-Pleurochrysis_carterae.AAC.1